MAFENEKKLRDAINRTVKDLGLQVDKVAFIPGNETTPDMMELTLGVSQEALMNMDEREQAKVDDIFTSLTSGFDLETGEDKPVIPDQRKFDIKAQIDDWLNDD